MSPGTVRVGCSGWQYRDWRGVLYPEGVGQARWLERYAEVFDTVEVNSTFYRLAPRRGRAVGRADAAGLPLRAQGEPLPHPHEEAARHRRRASSASTSASGRSRGTPKMGPVLWQLPEWFARDDDMLAGRARRSCPPGATASSSAHPSWFCDPVYDLLRRHDVALAIGDHPRARGSRSSLTAGWTYVRFHHGRRGRRGNYSDDRAARAGRSGWRTPRRCRHPRLLQQRLGRIRRAQRARPARHGAARRCRRRTALIGCARGVRRHGVESGRARRGRGRALARHRARLAPGAQRARDADRRHGRLHRRARRARS